MMYQTKVTNTYSNVIHNVHDHEHRTTMHIFQQYHNNTQEQQQLQSLELHPPMQSHPCLLILRQAAVEVIQA